MGHKLSQPKLLIVEGKDEVNLLSAILRRLEIADTDVVPFEGADSLRGFLKVIKELPNFESVVSLGIIRDADQDAGRTLQSIQDSLTAAGLPTPAAPLSPAGTSPRVVILVNPHGRAVGALEDVCLHAIRGDPAMACVDRYVDCLADLGADLPRRPSKSRVHAFIASRDRPEVSLGVAALQGYFPLDHEAFAPIKQLISML